MLTKPILFLFCCSEVNSTWLITSELANQRAWKALFTCVVYTNIKYRCNMLHFIIKQLIIYRKLPLVLCPMYKREQRVTQQVHHPLVPTHIQVHMYEPNHTLHQDQHLKFILKFISQFTIQYPLRSQYNSLLSAHSQWCHQHSHHSSR